MLFLFFMHRKFYNKMEICWGQKKWFCCVSLVEQNRKPKLKIYTHITAVRTSTQNDFQNETNFLGSDTIV